MLQEVFIRILNMSLTGAVVIAAVLLLRMVLRRAPKSISYGLWAVVLFRLLCPVSFSLPVSLLGMVNAPAAQQGTVQYIPEEFSVGPETEVLLQVPGAGDETFFPEDENRTASAQNGPEPARSQTESTQNREGAIGTSQRKLPGAAGILWCTGCLAMLLYGGISLAVFIRSLRGAYEMEEQETAAEQGLLRWGKWPVPRIYCKEKLPTSFVLGVFRPRIYLPEGMKQEELRFVLLHEQIHIRREDHILRMISYLALCIHWFNPLVWVAFFFSGWDMEMSCDEAVIRRLGSGIKKEYSASLLKLATGKPIFSGAPLAFGEGDTGSRIRNVLKYKKPGAMLVGIAVIVGILAAVFLAANPGEEETTDPGERGDMPVIAQQGIPEDDGQEEMLQQGTGSEEETVETVTAGQDGLPQEAVAARAEGAGGPPAEEATQPDGQKEGSGNSLLQAYDLRALYPSYDMETPERQRDILQSIYRGEELTLERLKKNLEEPVQLLEMYAGYQDISWGESTDSGGNAYVVCPIFDPTTGIDFSLRIRYRPEDNHIENLSLERSNDHLGATYGDLTPEAVDALSEGTGELFLWVRRYGFPEGRRDGSYEVHNIYTSMKPYQFRTDLGDGSWKGMTYRWWQEEPEYSQGSSAWGPPEWRNTACFMQVPSDLLVFEEGVLKGAELGYDHAERTTEWMTVEWCEEQAVLCRMKVDQYTASEIEEAAAAGNPIPEEYQTANIWYVCIGREDSPWGYVFAMKERHCALEEAVIFAESIRFRESAWQ